MAKSSKVDLWIVNHYANRPGSSGLSRSYDFGKKLVKLGYEVTIVCADIHYNTYEKLVDIPEGKNFLIEQIEGLRYYWIRTSRYNGNGLKRYMNIYSFFRGLNFNKLVQRLGKPDVIVGSSFHPLTIWACLKYKRSSGVPYVAEIRDLWPETMIQLGTSKLHPVVLLMDYIQKRVYCECDEIILNFPKAHEYVLELGLPIDRKKMTWISNGVNVEQFRNPAESYEFPLREGRYNVLNAGSLGNVYALEHLIEAAGILDQEGLPIDLHLVGSGPLEGKLKKQKEELNLSNVFFHKPIQKRKVPALIHQFDLLYASLMKSPLYKYGMSLTKLHEYMATGKPIVFAVNSVNNPVNDSGCGVTVDSSSPEDIAAGIKSIYTQSKAKQEELGLKGYRFAMENFDYDILTGKYDLVIQSAIRKGKERVKG